MVIASTFQTPGFCPVEHNPQFKCAFITHSPQYTYGAVAEMKQHNDSDEVFVLLAGNATLLTCEELGKEPVKTPLCPNTAYNVKQGTWHYLAVSEDAVVFVAESGSMKPQNTKTVKVNYFLSAAHG